MGGMLAMMQGLFLALLAGSLVSMQTIFNSKVNQHVGSWAATAFVLGLGCVASLLIGLLFEGKHLFDLQKMKLWYWFSGVIGVGVVTCLMQGIKRLGPTYAISIVLTAQLGFALFWDSLGWLGLEQVPFRFQQLIGVLVIIGGIVVFKAGGRRERQQSSKLM